MSNLIKGYSIRYEDKIKTLDMNEAAEEAQQRFIDSREGQRRIFGGDTFEPLSFSEEELAQESEEAAEEEGFVAGIKPAANLDEQQEELQQNAELIAKQSEQLDELREQADEILSQARAEAERIFAEAKESAEAAKQEIFETAKEEGYNAGQAALESERKQLHKEISELESGLRQDYEKQVSEIEPAFVEILIKYVKKLTGILCEDRKEIITYLIENELKSQEPGKNYIIRVSSQDIDTVREYRWQIDALVPDGAQLEIVEDKLLSRAQCLIEIDSRLFDCSIGVGLEGLTEDLKLLLRK